MSTRRVEGFPHYVGLNIIGFEERLRGDDSPQRSITEYPATVWSVREAGARIAKRTVLVLGLENVVLGVESPS